MSEERRRVTLRDVAEKAFVSVTTASEALRGLTRVDPETRANVIEAARELGYRTDTRARTLRSGKKAQLTATLFTHIPDPKTQRSPKTFWMRTNFALTNRLAEHNIANVWLPAAEPGLLDLPIDALLVVRTEDGSPSQLPPSIPFGLPTVLLGGTPTDPNDFTAIVPSELDDAVGCALEHLRDEGAQHIAFICTPQPLSPTKPIAKICQRWGEENGVRTQTVAIDEVRDEPLVQLLADGVDALFLLVDDESHEVEQVLASLRRLGKRVPEDVLVLSLAEGDYEEVLQPSVSALSFDGVLRGTLLADMVAEGLRTGTFTPPEMPFTLHVRESTQRSRAN